jgi:hypothetical protein
MQLICKNCFEDKELRGFIFSQGNIGRCDSCKEENIEVIAVEELLDFFQELLENFDANPKGKSLISVIQENWNLFKSNEIGNKILNSVLDELNLPFNNSDALVDFNQEINENINFWFELKKQLKWKRRYLTDIGFLTDDLGWDSFFESKSIIKQNDIFYRARLHKNADEDVYSKEKMFCPPKKSSTAGRANPIGIPYLYLSDNEETILYEIRAAYLDEVSVAKFALKNNLQQKIIISDFTEIPTLYHPGEVNKRIKATLLKQLISRDLSKPMRRYDSELDYISTQFICEFIKIFTNVQGIKFRSSLHNVGNNLVVFNQNIMDCIEVKKVEISKVEINFKNK